MMKYLTGIGVVASTDASVSTSFAEIYVSLSIFKLWRRPRYQIVAGINRYNYGAILQCAACNNSLFYCTEHRASNWAGLYFMAKPRKKQAQNHQPQRKKHIKNIRADLSAAKARVLSLDSHRPGHLLLPWTLAIERCSQRRECIVLWPSKWP